MDRRTALGVGLVLVAGISFASGSVLATLAYRLGLDWLNVMWWRFLVGASLAWAWVLLSSRRRSGLAAMPRRQIGIALGLGTVYAGNAGTYYAGLETVPAALAGVLVYVYPSSSRCSRSVSRPVSRVDGRTSRWCWRSPASS